MKRPKKEKLRIRVRVTARHIALGCIESSENCPVALAIQEAVTSFFEKKLKSKLGKLLFSTIMVTTDVTNGDSLGIEIDLYSDTGDSPLIISAETLNEEERIDKFIFAFDKLPDERVDLLNSIKYEWDDSDEIRKRIKMYRKDTRPFSFNLLVTTN